MDLVAKLPSMEAAALTVLRDNAARLAASGTSAQKTAATALLPAIEAELATRRAAKLAAAATAREEKRAVTGKPAAKRKS